MHHEFLKLPLEYLILQDRVHNVCSMHSLQFFALFLSSQMFTTQSILTWQDEYHLSFPVINKNHRRLKRSAFHSFYSVSLVSCSLRCQSHHRCFSSNYRDASNHGGICEMNGRGAEPPIEENEDLEYDKNSVYTHFRNIKVGLKTFLFSKKNTHPCLCLRHSGIFLTKLTCKTKYFDQRNCFNKFPHHLAYN